MKSDLPKLTKKILELFLRKYIHSPALGDLDEEFELLVEEIGLKQARRWYQNQVIQSIPSYLNHMIYWRLAMLSNYLKIAWRYLRKQKLYSVIKILSLSLGFGIFILFYLVSDWAFHFDAFHRDQDRIYSIVQVFCVSGIIDDKSIYLGLAPLIPVKKPVDSGYGLEKAMIPELLGQIEKGVARRVKTGEEFIDHDQNAHPLGIFLKILDQVLLPGFKRCPVFVLLIRQPVGNDFFIAAQTISPTPATGRVLLPRDPPFPRTLMHNADLTPELSAISNIVSC